MHLAVVTDTYVPEINGVAHTLEKIVNKLSAKGHKVSLVRPKIGEEEPPPFHTLIPSFILPLYREVRVGLPFTVDLRSLWERERPDIIYVATETFLGNKALKVARALNIPIVSGFHTNFQAYMKYYGLLGLKQVGLRYLRYFHNKTAATFAPSTYVASYLAKKGFHHIKILPRGVDTRLFHVDKRDIYLREKWGAREDTPVVLYVGRLAKEKNLSLVIKSFALMKKNRSDLRLVIVGDGPMRTSLQRCCPEAIFPGMLRGELLAKYYASADIFLFPSETETFGNVLLEALASGLVTVSYDYAAAQDCIVSGVNGLKAPLADEKAYLSLCREALPLCNRQDFREAVFSSVRTFTWKRIIDDFEHHLTQLIKKGKEPSLSTAYLYEKAAYKI